MFSVFERVTKRINGLFALTASVLVFVIMILVVGSVVARGLGMGVIWVHDVAQFAFVYVAFLSLAPALQTGQHVAVELFEPFFPPGVRRRLGYVAALACIVFGAVFLFQLWRVTQRSFMDNRLAVAVVEMQLKWLHVVGPIGAAQFVLTAVMNLGLAHRELRAEGQQVRSH